MSHPEPSERLSIAEFARRVDPSKDQRRAVQRAIAKGLLSLDKDGTLAASDVDGPWRRQNRRTIAREGATTDVVAGATTQVVAGVRQPKRVVAGTKRESPAEAAERIIAERPLLSLAEALQLKENYLGRLKQLEYDLKAGAVVAVAEIEKLYGADLAKVRTRMLAIPSQAAPQLLRLRTAPEVVEALRELIYEALAELSTRPPGLAPSHPKSAASSRE